jgi:cytochrome c biogenesis protein CcmG/thiol:disulfide interchange protein DsbE
VKNSRLCIPALFLALAVGCDRGAHPSQTGKAAPDFTIGDDANSFRLASNRGHMVLLNFWFSDCGPCILELPSLIQFHHEHPEIAVVGISIDEDEGAYRRFLLQRHVDFLTVRDPGQVVAEKYTTERWP